jgi:hypothetical protein
VKETLKLHAGPLELLLEPSSGFVRYVRLGSTEVLRGIYAAVRDQNWDTIPVRIENWRLEQTTERFWAHFTAIHQQDPVHFVWVGEIRGEPDGTLTYTLDGAARRRFLRNRVGFCMLHPVRECAGQPCVVGHPDGSEEQGEFPFLIAPHQPFKDLSWIRHTVAPGVEAEVWLEGDRFEMEDQRNWTDASYKTYCTPLSWPHPVWIEPGTLIRQRVTLRLQGTAQSVQAALHASGGADRAKQPPLVHTLPSLGFELSGSPGLDRDLLGALDPAHLRVNLLFEEDWEKRLAEAASLGVPLELALHLSQPEADLLALKQRIESIRLARVLVYQRGRNVVSDAALGRVRAHLPGIPVVGGTNIYFAQLNRERFDFGQVDAVCYSINPQVHLSDERTLFESLEVQGETVRSAWAFSHKAVVVSPVTLRPRFNPEALQPQDQAVEPDPRQSTLLCAAWTLGSIAALTQAGAHSLTYFQTHGPGGVMDGSGPFPVYAVFADLVRLRSQPCGVLLTPEYGGLLFKGNGVQTLLIANFCPEPRVSNLPQPFGTFELPPYAYRKEVRRG